jgi:hypothetical protein
MAIEQVGLPLLRAPARAEALRVVGRAGDFATNLTAIAALVALAIALLAFARENPVVELPRRLLLAGFSGVLLPTFVLATVLERSRTTIELVLFALGAAYAVTALVNASATGHADSRLARLLGAAATTTAVAALVAQALHTLSQSTLHAWIEHAHDAARAVAEVAHMLVLVVVALVALPERSSLRNRIARIAALFSLPMWLGAFYAAERVLGGEYPTALYDAQRVHLVLDAAPRLYAIPIALGLTGAVGGLLGSESAGRQASAAAALIVASGFAPLAPGRLLTLTLGLMLVARVVATRSAAASAVEPPDGARDALARPVDHVEAGRVAEP